MNATVLFKQSLTMTGYIETLQDIKILKASRGTRQLEGEEVGDIRIECYLGEKSIKKTITLNGFLINEANKLIDFIQEFINDFIYHNLEPQFILDIQDSVTDTKMKVSPMWSDKSIQNKKVKEVTFVKDSKWWKQHQTLETFDKSEKIIAYGHPINCKVSYKTILETKKRITKSPEDLSNFIDAIVQYCKDAKYIIQGEESAWYKEYNTYFDLLIFLKESNIVGEVKETLDAYCALLNSDRDIFVRCNKIISDLTKPLLDDLKIRIKSNLDNLKK